MTKIKQFTLTVNDPESVNYIFQTLADIEPVESLPDRIIVEQEANIEMEVAGVKGKFTKVRGDLPVTFFDTPHGVALVVPNKKPIVIALPADVDVPKLQAEIRARNEKHGIFPPKELFPDALASSAYVIHTSQEIDILERSAADGRIGVIWRNEEQRQSRVYEPKGASHRVELTLNDGDDNLCLADLEKLTFSQDADFALTMLYICSVLAPPSPLPPNLTAVGWIDLDDVMKKIGWYPAKLTKAEAAEKRAKLWRYLVYGDRATVIGSRTIPYRDKRTGEIIDTEVFSPIWRIHSVQRPLQQALFNEAPEVPMAVEIVISKQWERLLTLPDLAQYLPLGELLGSIPSGKVAGDWARCIGLSLANLWRRKPIEASQGLILPTRRELLTRYTPKTRTVEELLSSDKPRRAIKYWHEALNILADNGFLDRRGEVTQNTSPEGYNWHDKWLDEPVKLFLGVKAQPLIAERVDSLPPSKPKSLPSKKRRGRPRKKPLE